jgi:hypothetical protein
VEPELAALTSTAAATVVKLLATAAWERATSAVGGLWRRVHPERAETVQAELEDSRAEVLAARRAGDEQVEQALVGEWQGRLLPQLADGALPGSSRWPMIMFTPTAHPLAALATEIAALTGADPTTLAEEPRRCVEVLRGHIGDEGSGDRVLVVVDQFEELFPLCTDDQQRRTFIELLAQLASPPQPVGLVVVGVRADFYAACANYPHLRAALCSSCCPCWRWLPRELRSSHFDKPPLRTANVTSPSSTRLPCKLTECAALARPSRHN